MASRPARPADPPTAEGARPGELEDALNRFVYHPLARGLARTLRPTFVGPNAVSVAGMLLVWAAAWAYTGFAWPVSVLIGFLLHLSWHVVDGADGHLARLRGTASATGELVDGVCDYAGHTLLYIVLAAMLDDTLDGWAWTLAALAGASHIAQTNHAETQRRAYLWWVYGTPWLKHAKAEGDEIFAHGNWFSLGFSWMARLYLKLPNQMTPWAARIDVIVAESAGDPARLARVARLARERSGGTLAFQKLLGPNPRTLILGASMAAGSPLWFFLAEAVLLNLLLILSVRHHNEVARALAAELD
ncbi:MAG: CDP-alcohol phosphatidyltransferase family protein [Sphingosinicella sp.]|uniref:CDP-alcohol phosphatidyltransferase family protein n=1 Tax=Sphingosinicella sp. TaxID=1917971 RepID=UPI00403832BC